MRARWLLLALLLVAGGVALVRLGSDAGRGEPVRVAFAGPVTGPSAEDGLSGVRAIQLVFERINAEGGVGGRPLVLDVYDDSNQPERARANAPNIVAQRETVAVIGHNTSTCSIAARDVYGEGGLPAISGAATHVDVTRNAPWYFRTIYNDRTQGRLVTLYLREVLGARRFAVAHETQEYGAFLAEVMYETSAELGLPRPRLFAIDPAAGDREARAAAIAREVAAPGGPPVLVLAMLPDEGIALVKALRDARYEGDIVVTDALASQAFVDGFRGLDARPGFYTDGIYASTPFLFDAGGRRAADFSRAYLTRYGTPPDWYAAFAADAASVLVEALRRADLSPRPATIAEDRAALRDALARIDLHRPVEGVTGPTFFDAEGDATKPVPMGRFLGGDTVSAFTQLRPLPGVTDLEHVDGHPHPERLIEFGGQVFGRTEVARVGVRVNLFSNIDFDRGTFDLDFNLWFRDAGDPSVEDVVFTNAVGPVDLGAPLEEVVERGRFYRLYRVQATFRTDTVASGYGRHTLAVSLRNRQRTRDDLILASDSVGMNLGRHSRRSERGSSARRLLASSTGWALDDVFFFEDEVDEPGLGNPLYIAGGVGRPFSQLTIGAIVRRETSSLRGLLPVAWQRPLLAVGLVGTLALLGLGRGAAPRVRFVLQAAAAGMLLLAAEPLLGNWLRGRVGQLQLSQLTRTFDVLWWAVPAVFVNLAIERFVWKPAEQSSGRPVPTLLRWSVSAVIYLLAFFGVIAFVYDYTLTGLLATSGVLAMIVGLAVQLNITNLFAGVALNLERPFRVGDWIMIHGRTPDPDASVIGQVIDINWRTTRLHTADDTIIVIPNGQLSEKTITNFMGPHESSRFELTFTVDHAVPAERVLSVIQAALDEVTGSEAGPSADDPPKVRIKKVTESGVEYLVHYHLVPSRVSPNKGRHTVNEAILRHLHAAKIELAYPKRRVFEQRAPDPED